MPRLLAFVAPLVLVPALLPAAPVPPGAGKPVYYFPTQVGTKWVYDAKHEADVCGKIVTASEEKDGRFLVTVKATNVDFVDDETVSIAQYSVSKDGVFVVADFLENKENEKRYDPPHCLLKLPHKDGNSWENKLYNKTVYVAKKVETVKVPAGTFEAIRVEVDADLVTWYAPGVGIVKYQHNAIDQEFEILPATQEQEVASRQHVLNHCRSGPRSRVLPTALSPFLGACSAGA